MTDWWKKRTVRDVYKFVRVSRATGEELEMLPMLRGGTVTRNNGYKVSDGDVISIKKNDTRTFKADPDKGYVAVWTLSGETYVGNSFTMKMGSKDVTL